MNKSQKPINTSIISTALQKLIYFFKKIKIFFLKLFTALEIIFHIIKYYIVRVGYIIWYSINDELLLLELKSFLFVLTFSFFFYYFIVIELSILVFGYSLLCYRFLFIFVATLIIISWRLEAEFIKEKMSDVFSGQVYLWLKFYWGENFLSLFDFLTWYDRWPLLRLLFLDKHKEEIDEGRVLLSTISYCLIFFFLYSCLYRFDPWLINFVAKYFHPVINFFESRRNPRLEDFISAPVWFRNRLFNFLEYKNKTHTDTYHILKQMSEASPWIEDRANSQRAYKISLRKRNRFGDILFLWALSLQPHIRKIVFELEQPQISGTRFDPNWKIFFLWYLTQQFNDTKENFWTWYFFNDSKFWGMVKRFKTEINDEASRVDSLVIKNFKKNENFLPNTYELLIAQNYFERPFIDTKPFYQFSGTNWDYYSNLINQKNIEKLNSNWPLKEFFTTTPIYSTPHTISGLIGFWRNILKKKKNSAQNFSWFFSKYDDFFLKPNSTPNFDDFKNLIFFNLDIPMYSYYTIEHFDKLPVTLLKTLFSWPLTDEFFEQLYYKYNYWLYSLENCAGLKNINFSKWLDEAFDLSYLANLMNKRLDWIETITNNKGFISSLYNEIPTIQDLKYYSRKYLRLSNFIPVIEKKTLKDGFSQLDQKKSTSDKKKKVYIKLQESDIQNFVEMENRLWHYEVTFGLRPQNRNVFLPKQPSNFSDKTTNYPWYIMTLKYFSRANYSFVLPGFIRYYFPTPYPTAFSTFGQIWNKYQLYVSNRRSTIIGYSDSISQMKNSTPIALYSGVEAVLYFKPLFDVFEQIIKFFIRLLGSFVETLITQEIFVPLTSVFSLAIFAHILWFVNFYIYVFVVLYVVYFFILYYIWRVGFLWFYERMYVENFLSSYNNWIYWHTLNELWYNYKSPEQIVLLALHTNLLCHYSFINYNNFYFFSLKKKIKSLTSALIILSVFEDQMKEFQNFSKKFPTNEILIQKNEFFIFQSFFNIWVRKFQLLLFEGGTDLSLDHMVWNYYEYLNQISLFLTRGLWNNYYKINENNLLNSLMKQFTILTSSQSLSKNMLMLSTPILNSVLSWKILLKIFQYFTNIFYSNLNFTKSDFLLIKKSDFIAINYGLFVNYKFEFYNIITSSGLEIYDLMKDRDFNFLTKLNTTSFWDDWRYWIFAFFRSIWFVPKIRFPALNLHMTYEDTWLHLAWVAYANSWIAQSTFVRPYYNIIQHIWWTSKVYAKSTMYVDYFSGYNTTGIGTLDNVWNYMEKWYNYKNNYKIETIFGLVTTLDLPSDYLNYDDILPDENKNFDISFSDNMMDKKTTSRGYLKTNPPLNIYELGITPGFLFWLFKKLPISLFWLYFTFISQIEHLDKKFEYEFWSFEGYFSKLDIFDKKGDFTDYSDDYHKYDYYHKEFDILLNYDFENIFRNYIFTFDISFFFNHFLSWDFFSSNLSSIRPKSFNPSKFITDSEINNIFLSNRDILMKHDPYNFWLDKPLGMLDSYELHTIQKYKMVKQLDEYSFSRNRDDPFLNLDLEHSATEVGYSVYPKEDKKNLLEAYNEPFTGYWDKRFPNNPTIVKNAIAPFLVGWVAELVENTLDSTSFLYSLLYASPWIDINAWNQNNELTQHLLKFGINKYFKVQSFFGKNYYQMQLISWAFTWLNLLTSPLNYRYSFGPKTNARLDYWSWKVGMSLDYNNGLYSYWPYTGFRHSFASKLTPFDPLYGFYKSYRQVNDNPLVMDLSTGAIDYLMPKDDFNIIEDIRWAVDDPTVSEWEFTSEHIELFSIPYREVYFTFHHPYFIGYIYFWLLVSTTEDYYLGISNFSFKRLMLKEFLIWNSLLNLNFFQLSSKRNLQENWFWKQMSRYRLYYANPSNLTTLVDCILDDDINKSIDDMHTMQKFYLMNCYVINYFINFLKFSITDVMFLLDFTKIYNFTFQINWLSLDTPFSVNPYLVINKMNSLLDEKMLLKFFKNQMFSFSHWISVQEPFNLNLLYDWSNGAYLDLFNFTSYISTSRGCAALPSIFFDNPTYVAASVIKFPTDESEGLAKEFWYEQIWFVNSDILISSDLALNNLAMVDFFWSSLDFIFTFHSNFQVTNNIYTYLKFYIASEFFNNFEKFNNNKYIKFNSKIHGPVNSTFFKPWHLYFLYKLQKNLNHDALLFLLNTGLLFTNNKQFYNVVSAFRLRLANWYFQLHIFYKKIGHYISTFFFKKK